MAENPPIFFNPTAIAVQYDGENSEQVQNFCRTYAGSDAPGQLVAGDYYVAFMGKIYTMNERVFNASQGRV